MNIYIYIYIYKHIYIYIYIYIPCRGESCPAAVPSFEASPPGQPPFPVCGSATPNLPTNVYVSICICICICIGICNVYVHVYIPGDRLHCEVSSKGKLNTPNLPTNIIPTNTA